MTLFKNRQADNKLYSLIIVIKLCFVFIIILSVSKENKDNNIVYI